MNKLAAFSGMILAGVLLCGTQGMNAKAATITEEQAIAGISLGIENYYENVEEEESVDTLSLLSVPINIPDKLGIAKVDNYLNIRKASGTDQKVIGKLPRNAGCTVYSIDKDGWAKIKSGKVTGYVLADYLTTGNKASNLAQKVGRVVATVQTGGLRVRELASTDAPVLDLVGEGEEFDVVEEIVLNKEDPNATVWVGIAIDNETAYVSREYVELSYELKKAVAVEDTVAGISSSRSNLISTAKKYLGNRYVFGGNSLTRGIDCSGFTQQIFGMYGYSLPRTSRTQAQVGTSISASSAKAGDLVFYGNSSGINHVAICIGNGQIIHASNPRDGIKISNMFYRSPVRVIRVINN